MEQIPLPPAPSFGSTLMNVFSSPAEAFQGLKDSLQAPKFWIIPMIVTMLLAAASVTTIYTNESLKSEMHTIQSKSIQKMADEGKLTPEQAEQAENRSESMGSMFLVFGTLGGIIVVALSFFGAALFLWLADKAVLKTTAGYGKHLELYGIASWIGILGSIVTIGMMVGLGSLSASPSAALAIFGNYDSTIKLHKLLYAINIFSIWQTIVLGIGLSKFSDTPAVKGISVAFVLWLLWVGVSIVMGWGM